MSALARKQACVIIAAFATTKLFVIIMIIASISDITSNFRSGAR
jgi:hypothetical protein